MPGQNQNALVFRPTSTTQSLVSQLKERERAIVGNIASSLHAMLNTPAEAASAPGMQFPSKHSTFLTNT